MIHPVPRDVLAKVRKLALLPEEVRGSRWAVSITRLTTLKSLCQEPEVANRFVTYLARKTLERVRQGKGRSSHPDTAEQRVHKELMTEALTEMEGWLEEPSDRQRQRLLDLSGRIRAEQNELKNISWGPVRIINDWDLLVFENALSCLLNPVREAPYWVYQTARDYAERNKSGEGSGLISSSVPLVQDIADFWLQEFGLDPGALAAPAREKKASKDSTAGKPKDRFTTRQGQFLAFIHLYRKLHRQGPDQPEMARYFGVTAPSVHGMVVKLEELGLITRKPGVPGSVRVAIPEKDIPPLEDVPGPAW